MLGTAAIEVDATSIEVHPTDIRRVPQADKAYDLVEIETDRGTTICRYCEAEQARNGVVMVGGVGGGFDSPARGLYPRLAKDFLNHRISTLGVRYRHPTDLVESTIDTVLGIRYLESQGLSAIGLIGHSFGGAVAIQAAANNPAVRVVVAISTQAAGTEPVADLAGRAAVLLLHGNADPVLPPRYSEDVYRRAHEPRRLIVYDGAGHTLDEVAESLYVEVKAWILKHLPGTLV
ncbi:MULTISPECIES: S9 family peptidase [Methanoculleus]|jgi:pimeloyl-ACP methyl ester carboxylesterase|uniref:Dienelactone hydrolase family protein n=1 Tax=Methanoculleus thermophilus TaxID=2200 RepID=A0A1G9AEP2_9EURY|nr:MULTISPECIES: dienelactone hydrolase family protein [Methanoculleus]SDK25738.1 Dienelactone hydrolase family protein [Methanoculleus thermophilus]HQD26196.1 dienelactone hydrolase family protein [Methanoculleus thermophilus]